MGGLLQFISPIAASFPATGASGQAGPWRPNPKQMMPALTVMAPASSGSSTGASTPGSATAYVFDTATHITHEQEQVVTINPVQTGAAISDHAYLVPARVSADILVSDSCQSFSVGSFASGPSRSVSAFQSLLQLQATRQAVSIATRLKTYTNMMVVEVRAEEEQATRYALRARAAFQQIITASVELVDSTFTPLSDNYNASTDSTRPQATASTPLGPVAPQNVPGSVQQLNNTANASPNANLQNLPPVNAPGTWSSYPINSGGF